MMGRQAGDQSQLFYLFNLEERIPAGHLLRRINPIVTRVPCFRLRVSGQFYTDSIRKRAHAELDRGASSRRPGPFNLTF
jgi:hypothetical protein